MAPVEEEPRTVEDDVYQPSMDFVATPAVCQPHLEVPTVENIPDEMLMSGFNGDVQDGPTVGVSEMPDVPHAAPEVHDEPELEAPEEVYMPSFDYVPDGCHLHNEGPPSDDEDEEMDHFISLAHMCRDEQLFTSYYESIFQQQHPGQEQQNVNQCEEAEDESGEGEHQTGEGEDQAGVGEKRRRKFSPYVEKKKATENPLCEDEIVDELQDLDDLEDLEDLEGLKKKGIKYTPFKLNPNEIPNWKPGHVFKHRDFLFDVLRQYAIMTRRRVHVKRNDGDKLRAVCKGQGCEWYVYLRKLETNNVADYVLMNMQRDHAHTCSQVLDQKWLTAKWLGERYIEKIKANPHIPLAAIRQCVDEDFGLKIGRMKAYRAREHALDGIFGSAATQYKNLFYYKAELERTHPDSSVHIHYENTRDVGAVGPRFLRFYCCLGSLKKGWTRLCRPIIFLDACFLRGMYRGQLMTAMGIDPNNGWWPIAWAVTEAESYVQWKWFLDYLADDLELHANGPRFVFMSDQQKVFTSFVISHLHITLGM